jgi:hypothetical protein
MFFESPFCTANFMAKLQAKTVESRDGFANEMTLIANNEVKLIKERNTYKIFDVAVGKGNGTI